MIPKAREVRLTPKVRKVLEARCRAPSTPQGDVKRARIALLAAEGCSTRAIAQEVGVQPRIVSKWRWRLADHGLAGLEDRPRAHKKPIYGAATTRRSEPQRSRTTGPDAAGRRGAACADTLEFRAAHEPYRRTSYLSAPAPSAAGRHQPSKRAHL